MEAASAKGCRTKNDRPSEGQASADPIVSVIGDEKISRGVEYEVTRSVESGGAVNPGCGACRSWGTSQGSNHPVRAGKSHFSDRVIVGISHEQMAFGIKCQSSWGVESCSGPS